MDKKFSTFTVPNGDESLTLKVRITLNDMDRSADDWKVDLWNFAEDDFAAMRRMSRKKSLIVVMLADLCQDQIQAAGMTADDFGEAMIGDPLKDGLLAIAQQVSRFFPAKVQRAMLRLIDLSDSATDVIVDRSLAKLDELTPESLADLLTSESSAGGPADGSGSETPAPTASAN